MECLDCHGITKSYPGVTALRNVSLRFESGRIHGLIGENGAGKSTLMKLISGVEFPDSGKIEIDGREVEFRGVRNAMTAGIAMIHQELNLAEDLTAAENIFLGRELGSWRGLRSQVMLAQAEEWLRLAGCTEPASRLVREMSLAQRQLVEIAKALSCNADCLILDEPTAVLSNREKSNLYEVIHKLAASGKIVILISHLLRELLDHCDDIAILRDGELVDRCVPGDVDERRLAQLMVGRELGEVFPDREWATPDSEAAIELESPAGRVQIRPGEIVGFAGLIGSGRTELWETALGLRPGTARLTINGAPAKFEDYRQAMNRGAIYVSEDRKGAGLHLQLSVLHNISLPWLGRLGRCVIDKKQERSVAEKWKEKLSIRISNLDQGVGGLSGGNQQKVSLARQLQGNPALIVLDEPTRGVDVGSKSQIYAIISDLARQGRAVVVIGSELTELIGLCHRIVVMRSSQIVGELPGSDATEQSVMALAAGVA